MTKNFKEMLCIWVFVLIAMSCIAGMLGLWGTLIDEFGSSESLWSLGTLGIVVVASMLAADMLDYPD